MREDTHKGVGDWRIQLAEKELVPQITEMLNKEPTEAVKEEEDLELEQTEAKVSQNEEMKGE